VTDVFGFVNAMIILWNLKGSRRRNNRQRWNSIYSLLLFLSMLPILLLSYWWIKMNRF